jgi:hypothetical protein
MPHRSAGNGTTVLLTIGSRFSLRGCLIRQAAIVKEIAVISITHSKKKGPANRILSR